MPREYVKHLDQKYTQVSYELLKTCEPNEIALYCAIKLHAINKDKAWPSYDTFHRILGWSRDRISLTLKTMVQSRRLRVLKRSGRPTIYDISEYDRLAFSTTSPETGLPPVRKSDWYQSGNRTRTNRKERLENNERRVTHALVENDHGIQRALTPDQLERFKLGIYPTN